MKGKAFHFFILEMKLVPMERASEIRNGAGSCVRTSIEGSCLYLYPCPCVCV